MLCVQCADLIILAPGLSDLLAAQPRLIIIINLTASLRRLNLACSFPDSEARWN